MSYNPYKIIPAVLVAVIKGNEVLLARRVNTTYMDGWYALPGGHLEDNETLPEGAARELKEETGLSVKPADLELFHVYQNKGTPGRQYIGFMFRARKWKGKPGLQEDKADDINFFNINNLPEKLIPYHRTTLLNLEKPVYIEITPTGFDSIDILRK